MNRCALRASAPLALLVVTAALIAPAAQSTPQDGCTSAFCATFDLGTFDASAPTQPTTAAAQPTNLSLHLAAKSPSGADKSTWLSKVSAVLGTSSAKAFSVTDPATLPLGSYVAGSAATASSCAPGADGSGYATSCPAGHGTGLVELTGIGSQVAPATFGIKGVTVGLGGSLTATIGVWITGVLVPMEVTTSALLTYAPATATTGPTFSLATTPAVAPIGYLSADFSMNTLDLDLNGLVGQTPLIRQSTVCTTVTSTLTAQARSTTVASAPFTQTITGCPNPPSLVSVTPVAGQTTGFTFTTSAPTAAVAGRTATMEWVFGDGAKANTGPTTTHTYPKATPVVALVTAVDSAGARSSTLQVRIGGSAIRAKQKEGDLLTGSVTDQDTGAGIGGQQVAAYRCSGRTTPVAGCTQLGSAVTTASHGGFRLHIPEVKRAGFVVVSTPGGGTTSVTQPARFGDSRAVDVLPQPVVTLHLSKKQARPGSTVVLSGKVTPGKRGKTVRLQGFLRGRWRSVGKATVGARGRFATPYVVHAPGPKLKLRALVPGTAATLQATSPVKVLRITS